MTVRGQRIEIVELPQRDFYHQNILSQQSLKSISPDGAVGIETSTLAQLPPT
jgi:hypothetical protein